MSAGAIAGAIISMFTSDETSRHYKKEREKKQGELSKIDSKPIYVPDPRLGFIAEEHNSSNTIKEINYSVEGGYIKVIYNPNYHDYSCFWLFTDCFINSVKNIDLIIKGLMSKQMKEWELHHKYRSYGK